MQALSARGRFTAVHQRAHRQHAGRATVRVAAQKKQLMMWEALREAVDEEMERDPHVCVMGEHTVVVVHTQCYQLACKRRKRCSSLMKSSWTPWQRLLGNFGHGSWLPAAALLTAVHTVLAVLVR
jgi:hypothetical protein